MLKFAPICKVWFAIMTNTIQHQGIVENINGSHVSVKIVQTTACSSCSAKGHCSSSESKEKVIEVIDQHHLYEVGQSVILEGETSMGLKAVLLAFVIPFLWVIFFLFFFMNYMNNELYSALLSLVSLIPYYIVLWLLRNYIKQEFTFKIKPIK